MNILFAGGGTGGHLYPAVAIAERLEQLYPGTTVAFVGTERGIEATEIPRLGYRLHLLDVRGFRRGFSFSDMLNNAGVLLDFVRAVVKAAGIIRAEQPDVVVGTGGFVSGPLLAAAELMGRKTLIQEQNAFPGVTTRFLAAFATEVHLSFEESRKFFRRKQGVFVTGNPARSFTGIEQAEAQSFFGLQPGLPTLLVFGGSRGARSINNAVKTWISGAAGKANIIWQTGSLDDERLRKEVEPSATLWIGPYINDMRMAYGAADLVLCRAGASTLAELTNLGKASVLVPYPYATGNHQFFNAKALVDAGAAELVADADIALDQSRTKVFSILADPELRLRMREACRKEGRPEAALDLAGRIAGMANIK
ncbi:undecaprenyldiphospho-muramoylpentapeptide beta-N-acetylglucosaminyltransferase [Prosthecochloris sp. ZM]|uniref:undecaprenyldiphospho-muramoylpentapeptide beta-N-acetylglucosaminyltransferase n=1 Tax=Prosthecochloris sp. ZM TaxID=2283143 RepID=UPI000DF81A4B|nr:undecaprenyldiphospho-muramoylpentapeptide beta-N-acetylglucosaminyltransferase [Prosthecochloris sp. ZM]RDD31313.1 undecaprenyldiphospho-muramoylpentapeptide beta-N-acetylglucosaminyltransferase [Prosthecochloris sp. ZM]